MNKPGLRRKLQTALLALGCVGALGGCAATSALPPGAVAIARQGSFEAGGRFLGDPASRSLACDHGHVEYEIPVAAKPTSVFLWHSSSVAVWQRTWDGGEGFQSKILRAGYATYLWEGPRVGRADWGCEDYTYEAQAGRDQSNFGAWRLGPQFGTFWPGIQFPVDDPDALEQANRARYLEFDSVDNARLQARAAAAAFERIGPSVVLTNSAGGFRALLTALETDRISGIVAYENPGYVFPESMRPADEEPGPFGPVYVSDAEFARLTRIPIQLVWGDNIGKSDGWRAFRDQGQRFADAVNERGGQVEMLDLPAAGLHGNTHIPFADLNSDAVAALLFEWMDAHGF